MIGDTALSGGLIDISGCSLEDLDQLDNASLRTALAQLLDRDDKLEPTSAGFDSSI